MLGQAFPKRALWIFLRLHKVPNSFICAIDATAESPIPESPIAEAAASSQESGAKVQPVGCRPKNGQNKVTIGINKLQLPVHKPSAKDQLRQGAFCALWWKTLGHNLYEIKAVRKSRLRPSSSAQGVGQDARLRQTCIPESFRNKTHSIRRS